MAHAHPRHEVKRLAWIELLVFVRDHRHAVVQRRKQSVEETSGPGPVSGGPEAIPGLWKKLVRQLDAGKMAERHAMCMQPTLRGPGSARCIDHHCRIFGRGRNRHELR